MVHRTRVNKVRRTSRRHDRICRNAMSRQFDARMMQPSTGGRQPALKEVPAMGQAKMPVERGEVELN